MTPPQDPPATHAKRQHDALAKLVVLSNQCAQAEHDIHTEHRDAQTAADEHFKRTQEFITHRYDSSRRSNRRQLDERITQTKADAQAEHARLVQSSRDQLERLEASIEAKLAKAKEDYQHTTWTADSVLEGILNKLKRDKQDKLREAEKYHQSIAALVSACEQRLERYRMPGHPIPTPDVPAESSDTDSDPTPRYEAARRQAEEHLDHLSSLAIPTTLIGIKPYAFGFLVAALAGIVAHIASGTKDVNLLVILGAVGGALVVYGGVVWLLLKLARKQTIAALEPFGASVAEARAEIDHILAHFSAKRKAERAEATDAQQRAVAEAKEQFEPMFEKLKASGLKTLTDAKQSAQDQITQRQERAGQLVEDLTHRRDHGAEHNRAKKSQLLEMAGTKRDRLLTEADTRRAERMREVEGQWSEGRSLIETEINRLTAINAERFPEWEAPSWSSFSPPSSFSDVVRFGQLDIDTRQILTTLARSGRFTFDLPETFGVPGLLSSPDQRSMLIQAGREGRDEAIRSLQAVMARTLTAMPPGRVKFTLIDPVSLGQSFAGFMHLADHDESLVTSRIWSEPQHIAARLTDLTEHMENVIQKYLRNDFETIDEYNRQAGELAEPYRVLVVSDFPTGFSAEAIARLASIAATGARCGVFF